MLMAHCFPSYAYWATVMDISVKESPVYVLRARINHLNLITLQIVSAITLKYPLL